MQKKTAKKGAQKKRAPESLSKHPAGRKLIFISHDSRDAVLAKAFGELVVGVSAGALSYFCSSDSTGGIEYGAEWYQTLIENLIQASDVIALLTPRSFERPWILFEAGIAKGGSTRVFGVAFGIPFRQVNNGPFGQFQNCEDTEDKLTGLLVQLLRRNLKTNPREAPIRREVSLFLSEMGSKARTPPPESEVDAQLDANARLYEEVKLLAREAKGIRNERIIGPRFFEEFPLVGPKGYQPLGWLIFIGALRDEIPWLYEVGLELYWAMTVGERAQVQAAAARVLHAVDHGLQNPWLQSVMVDDDHERAMRHHHVVDLVEIYLDQLKTVRSKRVR